METPHDKKKVKSFSEFRKSKGQQWKSLVSKTSEKKGKNKEGNVQISIGLFEWNLKHMKLKPKRGKKVALTVSNIAPYSHILQKAVDKWKAFHSDCYDDEEDYVLLLEDGKEALFLPGSYKEFFTLKKYKEELGKDYNKITLFLCTRDDFSRQEDDAESSGPSSSKRSRIQTYFNDDGCFENYENDKQRSPVQTDIYLEDNTTKADNTKKVQAQINSDEALARKIQFEVDVPTIEIGDERVADEHDKSSESSQCSSASLPKLVKQMEKQVDKTGQFFLVVRRGAAFQRSLSLWQRACKTTSPQKLLRVKYMGESGIDTGAMAKEFLSDVVVQMGSAMFPNGCTY